MDDEEEEQKMRGVAGFKRFARQRAMYNRTKTHEYHWLENREQIAISREFTGGTLIIRIQCHALNEYIECGMSEDRSILREDTGLVRAGSRNVETYRFLYGLHDGNNTDQ